MNKVGYKVRQQIFDQLSGPHHWAGHVSESSFVSRVWDTSDMRSTDGRYDSALQDIQQHRERNYDWDEDWLVTDERFNLFGCADQIFFSFLAETLHPRVRRADTGELLEILNRLLHPTGFQLIQDGEFHGDPTYEVSRQGIHSTASVLSTPPSLKDPGTLHLELERIKRGLVNDPASAISASKNLLEALFKLILDDYDIEPANGDDLLKLCSKAMTPLELTPATAVSSSADGEIVKKMLRSLTATVQSTAELRNQFGAGHGQLQPSPALARHGKLAFNACVAVAEFVSETWSAKRARR